MDRVSGLLAWLDPPGRRAVAAVVSECPRLSLSPGTTLGAHELSAASVVFVERGAVMATTRAGASARRMVVGLAGPSGLLLPPGPGEEIAALEEAELTALTATAERALLAEPGGALAICRGLSEGVRQCRRSLAAFGYVAHSERLLQRLQQLARESGRVVPGGVLVGVPLTHELLAEMVGSSRETVTVALHRLEAEGFLSRVGRCYCLAVAPDEL
jgi:CRP/FNR family transcriptional regulator, cyclic AMP receptor protein